jgi:F0F1-type ATP synthase delta subunit
MTSTRIIVETVIPLSADQKKELAGVLKKKFGTDQFEEQLNADVLGGVRITAGSTQIDASIAGKLAQIRNA